MCTQGFHHADASPELHCHCPPCLKDWNRPAYWLWVCRGAEGMKTLSFGLGVRSVFSEAGESSSWSGRGESRFSLPDWSNGDAFQNSIFQHNSHILASWQPALWKGIHVTVWTRSFQIPSLLCTALYIQYTEVEVHTDRHLLYISSRASFSFYSQVTWIWPELSQQDRFRRLWGK